MSISSSKRKKIYQKYNGKCAYCGKNIDYNEMTIDHIIPLSKLQGCIKNNYTNLNPACFKCNMTKGDKTISEYKKSIGVKQFFFEMPKSKLLQQNDKGESVSKKQIQKEVFEWVKNNDIRDFRELVDYAKKSKPKWYNYLAESEVFMLALIVSNKKAFESNNLSGCWYKPENQYS